MQLMPSTAEWLCDTRGKDYSYGQLFEVDFNIDLGTYYLAYLFERFSFEYAIAAYNAGEGTVKRWQAQGIAIADIPYKETREYVSRVKRYISYYKTQGYYY